MLFFQRDWPAPQMPAPMVLGRHPDLGVDVSCNCLDPGTLDSPPFTVKVLYLENLPPPPSMAMPFLTFTIVLGDNNCLDVLSLWSFWVDERKQKGGGGSAYSVLVIILYFPAGLTFPASACQS